MTNAPKRSRLLSFSPASERPTRTAGDDRVIAGADHAEHDDFGGLHRDLIATGAAMDRRELFRIAARLGVGVSALSILGCGGDTETSPRSSSATGGGTNSTCSRVPENCRPLSGRRIQRPDGAESRWRGSQRYPIEFRRTERYGHRRALTIQLTMCPPRRARLSPAAPSISGTATRSDATRVCSSGATNQNYLRGVQEADAGGKVTFTSIYPGCYAGRWRTFTSRSIRAWRVRRAWPTNRRHRKSR